MNNYEVGFRHSINPSGSGGNYQYQSSNQGTMIVSAPSASQAQRMVQGQFGGGNNCAVFSTKQIYK
jgi:hypothetical protein